MRPPIVVLRPWVRDTVAIKQKLEDAGYIVIEADRDGVTFFPGDSVEGYGVEMEIPLTQARVDYLAATREELRRVGLGDQ